MTRYRIVAAIVAFLTFVAWSVPTPAPAQISCLEPLKGASPYAFEVITVGALAIRVAGAWKCAG